MKSERVTTAHPFSIRLIALDVDGTLLTSDHRISDANHRAVREAVENGLQIVLASARSPKALRPLLAELNISSHVVAYAGGLIAHIDQNPDAPLDVIDEHYLSLVSAREIVRFTSEESISIGWFVGETWYIPAWDPVLLREADVINMPPQVAPDLRSLPFAPHKLQCMVADESNISKLKGLLSELPQDCDGQFSHPTYLEVIPKGIDKATGLKQLGNRLGISLDEMAAIGDGDNDLPMLASVGLGIAMGNAGSCVRRSANWITASNDQDGVAVAIRRILAEMQEK